MSNQIAVYEADRLAIGRALRYTRRWCEAHQWEVGVAEMALGSAVLTYAVNTGAIEVGRHVVGSALSTVSSEGLAGSGIGASVGAVAGLVIGSIGVASAGAAVAVPAAVLALGGAWLFGATGYVVGEAVHAFLSPSIAELAGGASLLTIGLALVIDGARRVIRDKRVLTAVSAIKGRAIHLVERHMEIVATTAVELPRAVRRIGRLAGRSSAGAPAFAVASGVGGAAAGGAVAAGSVTVLGSHALGSAALSLGLVSAPVWPAVVGGLLAAGLGYAAWSGLQRVIGNVRAP